MTVVSGAQGWGERVRALARGELEPVVPKRAATVMVLRDRAAGGPDVHLLKRRTSMAFAGGMYAFPGGGVDPRDERPVRWAGPGLAEWGAWLGLEPAAAQAVVCAAVRETFEESGVLLAGSTGEEVVADTTGGDWEADRAALVAHELAFADFLDRRGLALRSDLLRPCARWVTPEFEERRYDTWFFLAALPAGQRARDVSGEADRTVWLPAAEAVAGYDRGELTMLPPTITMLRDLLPYGSAADALAGAAGRDLGPVMATATVGADGAVVLSWPGLGHPDRTLPGTVGPAVGAPGSAAPSADPVPSGAATFAGAPGSAAAPAGPVPSGAEGTAPAPAGTSPGAAESSVPAGAPRSVAAPGGPVPGAAESDAPPAAPATGGAERRGPR